MSQENQENQDGSKMKKQYDDVLAKLKSVLGGAEIKIPSKIENSEVADIVEELFKEEKKENIINFKNELKSLLKTHVQFRSEIAQKERELKQLETNKQKEFIKKANEIFSKIDNVAVLHSEYLKSLNQAVNEEDNPVNNAEE